MPTKMEEIRENARKADEWAKKLASDGNLLPREGVKTNRFTNEFPDINAPTNDSETPEVEETVSSESNAEDISLSANEPNVKAEEEEELVSSKQYKSAVKAMNEAQRKAAEAEKLLAEQAQERERYRQELENIKLRIQSQEEDQQDDSIDLDQVLSPYEEEIPETTELMKKAVRTVEEKMTKEFNQKFKTVEDHVRKQREEAENFKLLEQVRLRNERVKLVHPDYDDIRLSDEFKTWVYGEAPSIYQKVYEGTVDFDDSDAAKIIDDFKSFKGVTNKQPRPKVGSAQMAVKTASSVAPDMGINQEPEFSEEDIQKLPYMIHRVKDPAQRKALMEKADRYLTKFSNK